MAPTIHMRRKGKLLAIEGPVVFAVMNPLAEYEDGDIPQIAALVESLLEQHHTVAMLMIVEHATPKPTPDERRDMQLALARFGERLVVAYAFCGLGFWAGALQLVIAGVSRLAGSPMIMQRTVAETAERLALELIGLNPEQMTRDGEALRAELAADPAMCG